MHPKKLEESLKTNRKAPVGVSFAGPPNHPFVSSCHVHPDYHKSEDYDEVGESLMWNGIFVPAIVRRALEENKFSFLHLLLMWPGHLMQHLSRVTFSSFFDNLHYFYSLFESSAFKTKLQFWHVCHDQLTWALATRWDRGARSILLLRRFSGL